MLPYILSFLTILLFVFFIFRKPSVETYLLFVFFSIPFVGLKILPEYYGGFKAFDIISYMAFIILFKDFITVKNRFQDSLYLILSILFIVITIIGKIYSEFISDGIFTVLQVLPIFIFTRFFILYCGTYWPNRFKLINALKTGFIVSLLFIVLQIIFGLGFSFYESLNPNTFNESSGIIRYPGFFSDSQTNGQFLAMGSFIFLITANNISTKAKKINYVLFILAIIGVLLSGSRSPLGGFIIGCIFLIFFAGKKIRMYATAIGVVGAIAFLIFAPMLNIFNRSNNISDDYLFRESIWKETYDIVKEKPFLGIGLGNYADYTKKYKQNLYLEIETGEILYFDQPENGYLKILVEHGILVFGIFLLFLLLPIVQSLFLVRFSLNKDIIFVLAALFSWLIAFGTVYSISDSRLLIVVSTCISLLIVNSKKSYSTYKHEEISANENFNLSTKPQL